MDEAGDVRSGFEEANRVIALARRQLLHERARQAREVARRCALAASLGLDPDDLAPYGVWSPRVL